MDRAQLLEDVVKQGKYPQTIFVCDWHPSLNKVASVLKEHFHLIQQDRSLSNIFKENPRVAFRRPKTIKQHIIRNDIQGRPKPGKETTACGSCKLCPSISTELKITNTRKNITVTPTSGGTCRTRYVIYAARCKKCDLIYIGHTSEELRERFSKHRWDIRKRPSNTELSEHFGKDHTENDLEVTILQSGLWNDQEREFYEDKWICRLQTLSPTGINKSTKQYAKEMYACYRSVY